MNPGIFLLLALPLAACGSASASPYDSTDPLHCATIFSIGAAGAAERSYGAVAEEMNSRLIYVAKTQGGADWLNAARPKGLELAKSWEGSLDGPKAIRLLEECRAKQNADPKFLAAIPELRALAKRVAH